MKDIINFKNEWASQLINSSHIGALVVDKELRILYVNTHLCEMLGRDEAEILESNASIFYLDKEIISSILNAKPLDVEHQFRKKDGTLFWLNISGELIANEEKVLFSIMDITEQKIAQGKLEENNYNFEQYLDAIDKIDIGIFVVDEDYRVRYMNNTMVKWFGDQTNTICYSSVAGLSEPCSYCKLSEVIQENKKAIYEPSTPDGQSFEIVATSIKNSDGTTSKMEVIRNISAKKAVENSLIEQKDEFNYLAHHDTLTGLPNKLLFNDRLHQGMKKVKLTHSILALVFIDLDRFKEINDSLGHDTGDKVLIEVTSRLNTILKEQDTVARFGGDEFAIILEDLSLPEDAAVVARDILKLLAKPFSIDGNTLYISSSIGVSLYPNDGDNEADLLKFADSAMYKAKDEGRNNFQFYTPEMTVLALQKVLMEVSLRQAIENREFVVYFQPQVDGRDNKLVGMEALVRWKHPAMGLIPPAQFIPLAESTGLIVEIDRFVMKESMKQFSQWYKEGYNPGTLAMNLTVKQLHSENFLEILKNLIEITGTECKNIELEVTEGEIMKNPEVAIRVLKGISELGIELAIDDFGTGYSSLAYLKRLPINKLKIDQSFVRELPEDEEDVAIAQAVIALGKSLNLNVIAEGVETEAQRDFLVAQGCNHIQGYYYSRPVPADEMREILINGFPN